MDYLEPILASGSGMDADQIQFVIAPSRDEWQLKSVNVSLDSFEPRKPLPASWAGLRGPDLVAATGVPDAVFCHAGRFVATAHSRKGAMALLRLAFEGTVKGKRLVRPLSPCPAFVWAQDECFLA